jgi:Peptidase family M23
VKKLIAFAALIMAVIIWAPLAVAVVVVSVLAPGAVSAIECGADVPGAPTGEWRPPFHQRYALTSAFGRRFHPIYKEWRLHTGQDLSSLPGAGPVVAASAGIVISADWDRDYGNIVSLRHGNGVVTRYGHLASIDRDIVPGARVGIGQRVGMEGSTGTSTGLHLHFQVEINRTPVNPVRFMADRGAPLDGKAIALSTKATSPAALGLSGDAMEGGLGFPIPRPGNPRRNSLHNPALGGGYGDDAARFYAAEAAKVIQAFLHAAALTGRSLDDVLRWVANPASASEPAEILLQHPHAAPYWLGLLHGALHGDDRTAGNTITTAQQAMSLFFQEDIRRRCVPSPGRPATDLADVIRRGGTVYLLGREDPYASASPLMTAVAEHVMDTALGLANMSRWGRLCPPLLACLDELPSTAPLPTCKLGWQMSARWAFRLSTQPRPGVSWPRSSASPRPARCSD